MPVHDWTRTEVGLYHHFHQQWSGELCDGLNAGVLPPGYYALIDQRANRFEPDILALKKNPSSSGPEPTGGGLAVREAPPRVRFVTEESDREVYAAKANRLAVRNYYGELVAIIEIVSPGNKDSRRAIESFVKKSVDFIERGVSLLVVDLFPPTPRDPQGIHKAIWDEIREEPFELPPDKPLTAVAYSAVIPRRAYIEPLAVGDLLPAMPVFLDRETYIPAPLEETYMRTWNKCPQQMRELVEHPES